MNTIILIKLIAAHLTGDFILQSDTICAEKCSTSFRQIPCTNFSCFSSSGIGLCLRRSMELLDYSCRDWDQSFHYRLGQNNE